MNKVFKNHIKNKIDMTLVGCESQLAFGTIGVKKNNASLQQWLNVALYTLHRADFVDQTWEKWFGIRQIHSVQPQPYF